MILLKLGAACAVRHFPLLSHRGSLRRMLPLAGLCGLVACGEVDDGAPPLTATIGQMLRAGQNEQAQSFVRFDVLVTDEEGLPYSCEDGDLSVVVEVSENGGKSYRTLRRNRVEIACPSSVGPDLSLVVDNSGSEADYLDELSAASHQLIDSVEAAQGRIGVVRVSTEAELLGPLSADSESSHTAVDEMFVSNGWTALYDGVRLANESLGGAEANTEDVRGGLESGSCGQSARRAIVLFTDGRENNSADQNATVSYPGDGIETLRGDLANLRVQGAKTPIYPVGLGGEVDGEHLSELASASGGVYSHVDSASQLESVFDRLGRYLAPSYSVCSELGARHCGRLDVRLSYSWQSEEGEVRSGQQEQVINVPCAIEVAKGRSATILMALSQSEISRPQATELAAKAVEWVSPVATPQVLVVLDDNHHGEHEGDADYVAKLLIDRGYGVTRIDEPRHGIELGHVDGYDVVWFSNPGYPMDDEISFETLRAVVAQGRGVVLQGDDMAASFGRSFDMTPLTGLTYRNNGTRACNQQVNNRASAAFYRPSYESGHDVTASLGGAMWLYGDDMDHTTPAGHGETVLAWADQGTSLDATSDCELKIPAVVAHTPQAPLRGPRR